MPRLTPSDIEKSGRPDLAGVSHLELEETVWRLRGSGAGFRPGREFGKQFASARRRRALVAAVTEETGRAGRRRQRSGLLAGRRQTNRSWAGWRAMAMTPTAIIPGATLPCAADPQGVRTVPVTCLRTRENQSDRLESDDGLHQAKEVGTESGELDSRWQHRLEAVLAGKRVPGLIP
jgi:hypothetical protein